VPPEIDGGNIIAFETAPRRHHFGTGGHTARAIPPTPIGWQKESGKYHPDRIPYQIPISSLNAALIRLHVADYQGLITCFRLAGLFLGLPPADGLNFRPNAGSVSFSHLRTTRASW